MNCEPRLPSKNTCYRTKGTKALYENCDYFWRMTEIDYKHIDFALERISEANLSMYILRERTEQAIFTKAINLNLARNFTEMQGAIHGCVTFTEEGSKVYAFGKGYKAYCEERNSKSKRDKLQYYLLVITSIFVFLGAILGVWQPIQDKCIKYVITSILLLGVLSIVLLITKKRL